MPAADSTTAAPIDDTPTTPRAVDPIAPVAAADGKPPKVPVNRETLRQAARLFGYLLPYRGTVLCRDGRAACARPSLGLCFPYLIGSLIDTATRARQPSGRTGGNGSRRSGQCPDRAGQPPRPGGSQPAAPRPTQRLRPAVAAAASASTASSCCCSWSNSRIQAALHVCAGDIVQRRSGEKALVQIRRDTYSRGSSPLPMTFFARRRVGELVQPHLRRPDPDRGHPHRGHAAIPAPDPRCCSAG